MENSPENLLHALRSVKIFTALSTSHLKQLLSVIKVINLHSKEVLSLGDQWANYFFVVLEGHLHEVEKKRHRKKLTQTDIVQGETIEELKLLSKSRKPHHHLIMASEDSVLLAIPIKWFNQMAEKSSEFNQVLLEVAGVAAHQLARTNVAYVSLFKRFLNLSDNVIYILGLLSIFIFFVPWVKKILMETSYPLIWSTGMIALVGVSTALGAKSTGLSWSDLGIRTEHLVKHILSAIGLTLIVIIIALVVQRLSQKFNLMFSLHELAGVKILSHLTVSRRIYGVVLYSFFCFVHEFVARGCLQGPLSMVLGGRHVTLKSIVIANIIWAAFHVPYSLQVGFVSLIFGLFWGWLYAWQRNIFSVSISNMMIGFAIVLF